MGGFCCVTMRLTAVRGRVQSRCGEAVTIAASVGPTSRREGARLILFFLQPLPGCQERTSGSHCPLRLVRLGQPSGRSQAVGTDQAEGVRDGAGWRRRAQGS